MLVLPRPTSRWTSAPTHSGAHRDPVLGSLGRWPMSKDLGQSQTWPPWLPIPSCVTWGRSFFLWKKTCLRTCWCVRRRPRAAEGPSSHLGSLRGRMGLLTGLSVRGREGEVGVVRGWASGGGRCPRWPRPSVSEGAAEGGLGRDIARPLFQLSSRVKPGHSLAQTCQKHWQRLSLLQPTPGNSVTFLSASFP